MDPKSFILTCPHCGAKNRVPRQRIQERLICGRCRHHLPMMGKFPDYPLEVSDRTFQQEVLSFPGPLLLHGYGPHCGYSHKTMPILQQLAMEYAGRVKFVQLNVDTNPVIVGQFALQGTPTLLYFKAGRLMNRQAGFQTREEIERLIEAML